MLQSIIFFPVTINFFGRMFFNVFLKQGSLKTMPLLHNEELFW